ncbi:hypothetical protein [Acinetobacter courvalinii]|uniref:hypothetical protein n=1 Tax=Acinetobacter courvalinii TaxID=280147 RepID=UPI0021D12520|nr:hypothetical protein [Acinetobacter courvalinii]MCU4367339.1 hypothetical protein [Acinetobacter courvalinii]MCU4445545.1 hypothetical protein [Acinetobacter courvalinii]
MFFLLFFLFLVYSKSTFAEKYDINFNDKINVFLSTKDAIANNVYLDTINNQKVVVSDGSSSSSSRFLYFLTIKNGRVYVSNIIGETESNAILNNFVIRDYNKILDNNILDDGYFLQSKIDKKINRMDSILINEKLDKGENLFINMGGVGKYNMYMYYDNIEKFSDRSPEYIVECNGVKSKLKRNRTIYMGYDSKNLSKAKFIGIKSSNEYEYLEGDELDVFFKKNGVKCN